ncbi:MAG TPA: hypothetical protein VGN37_24955 [Actinocatenispora sp.]
MVRRTLLPVFARTLAAAVALGGCSSGCADKPGVYRNGSVEGPNPVDISRAGPERLSRYRRLSGGHRAAREAVPKSTVEGGNVDDMAVERFIPSSTDVTIFVGVTGPRGHKQVRATKDGTVTETVSRESG